MAPAAKPSLPDGLTPLEQALIQTLQQGHTDFVKELRTFRWQMLGLVAFLVAIVALLKGVDPKDAAAVVPQVVQGASVPAPDEPPEPK